VKIIEHNDPFKHLVLEEFLTEEEICLVYYRCRNKVDENKYNDKSMFFEHGEYQNNSGVDISFTDELSIKITKQLNEVAEYYGLLDDNFDWNFNCNLTYYNPDKPLRPHNDDWNELSKYGAGRLKLLVYLGLNDQEYKDWGTKLYTRSDDYSSFVKEIKFVPGNAMCFEATDKSYHGTDFTHGIEGYRFILGAEYVNSSLITTEPGE
tara:strand:+ start:716 stop:1336 length:621 start_codon:yes stop_codon:yes gene_type:complete